MWHLIFRYGLRILLLRLATPRVNTAASWLWREQRRRVNRRAPSRRHDPAIGKDGIGNQDVHAQEIAFKFYD